jgi:hypothetical protein
MKSLLIYKPKTALEPSFATALAALTYPMLAATYDDFALIQNAGKSASTNLILLLTTPMKENAKSES